VAHCIQAWMSFYNLVADITPHPDPTDPPDSSAGIAYDRYLDPHDPRWHSPADQIDWDPRLGEDHG
jgi:hypothetical protein